MCPIVVLLGHMVVLFLVFREMQIKTTMRYYYFITVRITIIKKSKINAGEGVEKGEPFYT